MQTVNCVVYAGSRLEQLDWQEGTIRQVSLEAVTGKCAKNVRGGYAQCCIRDGGRPTGVGLQGLISNCRMLLNW